MWAEPNKKMNSLPSFFFRFSSRSVHYLASTLNIHAFRSLRKAARMSVIHGLTVQNVVHGLTVQNVVPRRKIFTVFFKLLFY